MRYVDFSGSAGKNSAGQIAEPGAMFGKLRFGLLGRRDPNCEALRRLWTGGHCASTLYVTSF
jgi:hypothetical protein